MSGAQDDVQAGIDADATRHTDTSSPPWTPPEQTVVLGGPPVTVRTGPPMAFQAAGGADWQRGDGWRYRPLNAAALAMQARHVAALMQDLANGMAAFGRGRGVWPQHSAELLGASKMLAEWAEEMETEAAEP